MTSIGSLFEIFPFVGWMVFALLGACIGSFANVVVYRLPIIEERAVNAQLGIREPVAGVAPDSVFNLSVPRSRCKACGHQIRWYENIPVLSYLALKGKCSVCSTPYSSRYLITEVLVACLFAGVAMRHGPTLSALCLCGLMAVLVVLAQIDLERQELPDSLVYLLLWGGLLVAWQGLGITGGLHNAFVGVMAGYLSLSVLAAAYKAVRGHEGLGRGDIKLLAAMGGWLGAWEIHNVLLCAGLSLLAAYALRWRPAEPQTSEHRGLMRGQLEEGIGDHGCKNHIPFGPFIALGAIAVVLSP